MNFGVVEAKVFRTGRNPTYSYITTFPAEAPGAIMLVHSRPKPKLTSWQVHERLWQPGPQTMHEVLEGTRVISLFAMFLEPGLNRRRLLGFHFRVPMVMDAERGDEQVNLLKKPGAGGKLPPFRAILGESPPVLSPNALQGQG